MNPKGHSVAVDRDWQGDGHGVSNCFRAHRMETPRRARSHSANMLAFFSSNASFTGVKHTLSLPPLEERAPRPIERRNSFGGIRTPFWRWSDPSQRSLNRCTTDVRYHVKRVPSSAKDGLKTQMAHAGMRNGASSLLLAACAGAAGASAYGKGAWMGEWMRAALGRQGEDGSTVAEHLAKLTQDVKNIAHVNHTSQNKGSAHSIWTLAAFGTVLGVAMVKMRKLRLDDLMYVTQHTFRGGMDCMQEAVKGLQGKFECLKTYLMESLEKLETQQKEINDMQHGLRTDFHNIQQQLVELGENLESKQDATLQGVFLLCKMVSRSQIVHEHSQDAKELQLYLTGDDCTMETVRNNCTRHKCLEAGRMPPQWSYHHSPCSLEMPHGLHNWKVLIEEGRRNIVQHVSAS